ncbi:MAG TPA: hypothetical protein G4O00_14210, partial [Thermoflexia bacterium]|nr:hypothetical protein [Thermoflexia bacterium]
MKRLAVACSLAVFAVLLLAVAVAQAGGPVIDLGSSEEDLRVVGINALDYLGEVASGDINGDGLDDLIIGASGFDAMTPTRTNAGAAYVFWGTSGRLTGTVDLDSTSADLTVYGPGVTYALGRFVAAGDINGDGVDDLLMGADYASVDGYTRNGAVYVLFGSSSLSGTVDLYTDTADVTVYGAASYDHLGRSLASCDVSGDGIPDLIMGAYQYDQSAGVDGSGAVYVIFGGTSLSKTIQLDSGGADFTILGDDPGDRLGRSVACGDVDGDGTADIIAGAYRADQTWGSDAGEVYVIYGGSTLSGTLDLSTTAPDVLLRGVGAGDEAGFYVASGDLNGDGTDDLLIGAYRADVDWPNSETGTAYVIYGGSLSATMNLSETADVTIYGAAQDDRLSRSLTSGDFNGDGYDDLLMGAPLADVTTRTNAGTSYVIYGAPDLTSTIYLSSTNLVSIKVLGDDIDDQAGRASGAGDLDGDGADDLIIGAVLAGGTDSGETYV